MTEYLTIDSLESNRIEITFNIIPKYSCIVNKEVAIELIIRNPSQIRHLLWRRNNETVIAYITINYQLCIIYHYYSMLYDIPNNQKNIKCEINQ